MLYDLSDVFQLRQASTRLDTLARRGAVVELTEKRARTLSQNAYLHVCIAYLALRLGETTDYVKRYYFKMYCNKETFLRRKYDQHLKSDVAYMRSSADLSSEEMAVAIDRFRNWAASIGEYIPSSGEHAAIQQMQIEIQRNTQYL